jgi:hypothetical protein
MFRLEKNTQAGPHFAASVIKSTPPRFMGNSVGMTRSPEGTNLDMQASGRTRFIETSKGRPKAKMRLFGTRDVRSSMSTMSGMNCFARVLSSVDGEGEEQLFTPP